MWFLGLLKWNGLPVHSTSVSVIICFPVTSRPRYSTRSPATRRTWTVPFLGKSYPFQQRWLGVQLCMCCLTWQTGRVFQTEWRHYLCGLLWTYVGNQYYLCILLLPYYHVALRNKDGVMPVFQMACNCDFFDCSFDCLLHLHNRTIIISK